MPGKSKPFINPEDYTYDLPQDRIAMFPVGKRDQSKLLFYDKGSISHHTFQEIGNLLPERSLLVFNNSRVIPARLHFRKSTGALIEILLLNPVYPSRELSIALQTKDETIWECMIGNLKRWHDHSSLMLTMKEGVNEIQLSAEVEDIDGGLVKFRWDKPGKTFGEIISLAGKIPLPPYIHREAVPDDYIRYQTVYSRIDGAVASSTAGLHFTENILEDLVKKDFKLEFITLHIGAGTFQPIKTGNAYDHDMHTEQIVITSQNIENLIRHEGPVIAVGTTSLRTLESLYWYGTALLKDGQDKFSIDKLEPYHYNDNQLPTRGESLNAIKQYFSESVTKILTGETGIYILPGYKFRICNGLITNYHLPGSTLILLVAAFTGNDWKRIYSEAIMNDYRFLSYGDSSLLLP